MVTASVCLAVVSALAIFMGHGLGFYLYHKAGQIPNLTCYALWFALSLPITISYFGFNPDPYCLLVPAANAAACLTVILVIGSYLGSGTSVWSQPDPGDKLTFGAIVVAIGFWWLFESPVMGNWFLTVALIVNFVPLVQAIWRYPDSPVWRFWQPWLLWTLAYAGNLTVVLWRSARESEDLFYPMVACLANALVTVFLCWPKTNEGAQVLTSPCCQGRISRIYVAGRPKLYCLTCGIELILTGNLKIPRQYCDVN